MGREYELKFQADADKVSAIFAAYPLPWQEIAMETTYYDTMDGAISGQHWTLRRRLENGRSVCTLKTPAPDGGRGEWETEKSSIREAIAELSFLSGFTLPAGETLLPVCGARFRRLCATVVLPHGTAELALDQGVLLGGGRELPLCEVEVEAKSGSEEDVRTFAETLAAAYGLTPEPESKYRRASALAEGGAPHAV